MTHAISLEPAQAKADRRTVASIAKETETSVEIVKALYEEEVATLIAQARVKQYVGVLATKRVRQQLRVLGQQH
jgi:Protein of unknown function (DUF3562)